MLKADSGFWEVAGYVLWLVGSALFGVVSYRNDDMLSLAGSVLFFLGILAVMVPMIHSYLNTKSH